MKNLKIVGTSHISKESVDEIKKAFEEFKPDFVAVELDLNRLQALMTDKKPSLSPANIFRVGLAGYLFSAIGSLAQKKLGDLVGVKPGAEMKAAVKLAGEKKLPILLVDQDIRLTLKKLSQRTKIREKTRVALDLLKGLLGLGPKLKVDLRKVPPQKFIDEIMVLMKKRYPAIHYTLVDERNSIMAKRLFKHWKSHPGRKTLAVIGAGHKKEMEGLLKKLYQSNLTKE